MKIALSKLKDYNPFKNQVWLGLIRPISIEEVEECMDNKWYAEYPLVGHDIDREEHASRIAYLVVNGWDDEIQIDVGVEGLTMPQWIISDGNHRLAAAFYREDEFIECDLSGEVTKIKELFGGDLSTN